MEIYKKIDGYDIYYISNYGNVKSVKPYFKDVILKGRKTWCGYYRVSLHKNRKQKDLSIHRLVAEYFIENPYNKECVNHINGIKTDNRVENLEWVTRSENQKHAYKHLNVNRKGRKIIRVKGSDKKIYNKITEAAKDVGTNPRNISQCLSKKSKSAKGYKWEYYDYKDSRNKSKRTRNSRG